MSELDCTTCGGVAPASGRPCICKNTNRIHVEIQGLREALLDAQREIERLRINDPVFAAGLAATLKEECERQYARAEQAEAQVRALREALTELHALIEEGWLVRNTVNDGHLPSYLKESARLVNALAAAQKALALATPPAPTEPA